MKTGFVYDESCYFTVVSCNIVARKTNIEGLRRSAIETSSK